MRPCICAPGASMSKKCRVNCILEGKYFIGNHSPRRNRIISGLLRHDVLMHVSYALAVGISAFPHGVYLRYLVDY